MLLQRPPAAIEIPLEPSPPAAAVPVPPRAPQEPLPPLPPLWDSDGLDAVQQRARALEATFQTPDDDALPADPWAEQVDALRLRLNAVQQESPAAPWPKSSAPSPQLQE